MVKSMRSTKRASKARRDHINAEIRSLRALLPICADENERLSYLHSMSIICAFMRKSAQLAGVCGNSPDVSLPQPDVLQALSGFIVAFTTEGKLLYVSENVSQYLGLSMVDVLQGDTFYDMIESQDVEKVKFLLKEEPSASERSFVCRMVTSKAFRLQYGSCCSVLVRVRETPSLSLAFCTPTVNKLRDLNHSTCLQTLHKPDMSFTYAPHSVFFHLGFSSEEMIGRSWYRLLHPDDLTVSASLHKRLLESDAEVEMVVRLQCKDLTWVWVYIQAHMEEAQQAISCRNHIISETEAIYLKEKLYSSVSTSSLKRHTDNHNLNHNFNHNLNYNLNHNPKTRRTSENSRSSSVCLGEQSGFFCTPPYSPTSSLSSGFLSEVYDSVDHFSAFPQLFSDPLCELQTAAVFQPSEGRSEPVLYPEHLHSFPPHLGAPEGALTPEPSPVSERHFLYSGSDEVSVLAHQIYSLASSFDSSVNAAPCWPHASPLLDQRLIEGILRDLHVVKENQNLPVDFCEVNPLDQCLYGDISEDVLIEESMY